jgi:hypothetical protein
MVRTTDSTQNTGTTGENTNTNTGTTNTQPPFDINNLLGGILSTPPNQFIQISNLGFEDMGGIGGTTGQVGNNPFGNIFQNLLRPRPGGNTTTTNQTTTNTNINNITTNTTTNNTNTGGTTTNTTNQQPNNAYPVLVPPNQQISQLSNIVSEQTANNNALMPNIPEHTYPRNLLSALGSTLRNYYSNMSIFLPLILRLADGLERESLMTNSEDRRKLQELSRNVARGMNEITTSSTTIGNILNGLNVGNAPGQGYATFHAAISQLAVVPGVTSTNNTNTNTNNTTSTNTNSANNTANPMNNILSQLNQPGGLQNMMSMVGSMLGGGSGSGSGGSNMPGGNNMMNMFSSILGGMGNNTGTTSTNNNNFNNQINSLLTTLLNEEDQHNENQMDVEESDKEKIINSVNY